MSHRNARPWRGLRTALGAAALLAALASLAPVAAAADAQPAARAAATPEARRPGLVDLNTATEKELEALPHVGPALAQRIVDYRKTAGPFKKVDELLNVKGIGAKSLETIRPLVTVGAPGASSGAGP